MSFYDGNWKESESCGLEMVESCNREAGNQFLNINQNTRTNQAKFVSASSNDAFFFSTYPNTVEGFLPK